MPRLLCCLVLVVSLAVVLVGSLAVGDSKSMDMSTDSKSTPSKKAPVSKSAPSKSARQASKKSLQKKAPVGKSRHSASINKAASTGFKCSKQEFKGLLKCCKMPAIEFFPKDLDLECNDNRKDEGAIVFAREFVMNRQQQHDNNTVSFNNNNTVTAVAPGACIVECMFRNKSLLVNDSLDMDLAKSYLAVSAPFEWSDIVKSVLEVCRPVVIGYPTHALPNPANTTVTCSLDPLLLMQCMYKNLITLCPTKLQVQSPPRCKNSVANLAKCDGSLTTTKAPSTTTGSTSGSSSSGSSSSGSSSGSPATSGSSETTKETTTVAPSVGKLPDY